MLKMSEKGSLARIEKYRKAGNIKLLEKEEQFYKDNYSNSKPSEKSKKSK